MVPDLASKQRRLSFDNAKFNNRLAYLINFLSVAILIFCGVVYTVRYWFVVHKITIEGQINHVTPVQLSYVAHNRLHGTMFTLDIAELKSEFEQLPWVKQVSVKRKFPSTIIVSLVEYKAIARINDDYLLAEDGEVFSGADANIELPVLYVDNSHADMAYAKYLEIEKILSAHGDHIDRLWFNNLPLVKFTTKNNLNITMCDSAATDKLQILNSQWDALHKLNPNLTSLNFCYKNAVAINSPNSVINTSKIIK